MTDKHNSSDFGQTFLSISNECIRKLSFRMFLGGKEQKLNPKLGSVQKTAHSLQEKNATFPNRQIIVQSQQ